MFEFVTTGNISKFCKLAKFAFKLNAKFILSYVLCSERHFSRPIVEAKSPSPSPSPEDTKEHPVSVCVTRNHRIRRARSSLENALRVLTTPADANLEIALCVLPMRAVCVYGGGEVSY